MNSNDGRCPDALAVVGTGDLWGRLGDLQVKSEPLDVNTHMKMTKVRAKPKVKNKQLEAAPC
jgi:hypothetical protein